MDQTITGKPLGIGSLPHRNVDEACAVVLRYLPDSPFWPELPQRDWRESMGIEQARSLPGAVIDSDKQRAYFDLESDHTADLGKFYESYINDRFDDFAISPGFLPGFDAMCALLSSSSVHPALLKGQLTGPTTLGLMMKDGNGRALLYDEQMMDVLVKATRLKAVWMISRMAPLCDTPAVFFDEPMLQSVGSAAIPIERDTAVLRLKEIVTDLDCITGGHCCGNTDWSIMMEAGFDVIAYDAWSFGDTLGLYGQALAEFIARGGAVAWGVVPATAEGAQLESAIFVEKLQALIHSTAAKCGLTANELREHSFVTPSCGLGSLTETEAERILASTSAVAATIR